MKTREWEDTGYTKSFTVSKFAISVCV